MEDILKTRDRIEQKIAELEIARSYIQQYAQEKAKAIAEYDLVVAKILVLLNNGSLCEWQEETFKKIDSNSKLSVAKGMCWEQGLKREEKIGQYNGLITTIDCIKAELNGYQSINRYLE